MCEHCTKENPKPIETKGRYGGFNIAIDSYFDNTYYIDVDCITFDGGNHTSFEINFCPMCGRKLKED